MQRRLWTSGAALAMGAAMALVPVGARSAGAAVRHRMVPSPAAGIIRPHRAGGPAAAATAAAPAVGNMTYHGGPVMHHVTEYAVYWQPPGNYMSPNFETLINRWLADIGTTSGYNVLQQYGDGTGPPGLDVTFGGAWTDTSAFLHAGTKADPVTDQDLLDGAISHALTANPTWADDNSHQISVFLPYGVYLGSGTARSFVDFCAFHFAYALGAETVATHPVNAMPYVGTDAAGCDALHANTSPIAPNLDADADSEINTLSHEVFESVSDPAYDSGAMKATGWYWQDPNHETGDMCNFVFGPLDANDGDIVLNGHEYIMQTEWSNQAANPVSPSTANGCVMKSPIATSATVTSTANPAGFGQPVTFTTTVGPSQATKPTGTVQFKDGSTVLAAAVPLTGGVATFTASGLVAGPHPITVAYGGDSNYSAVTSAPLNQTVNPSLFIYPLDGQTGVDTTARLTWGALSGAQAYLLTIGTTQYGSDLLSSGLLPPSQTSVAMPVLPVGQTLHATLFMAVNGVWTFQTVAFTAAPGLASFTYPMNDQVGVDRTRQFTWAGIPAAQGYFLVVGTSLNGSDVLAAVTPASQLTYSMAGLPAGKTLFALLFTEVNGQWNRYQSITFTTAGTATFTYPVNNQVSVDTAQPITWATVPGAQNFYLLVGTTPYGHDVLAALTPANQATHAMAGAPAGKTLYAVLFTEINGIWSQYQSITFTTAGTATFTYPVNNQVLVNTNRQFTWGGIATAQSYYLLVGTTQYGHDVLAAVLPAGQTSYTMAAVPAGRNLYALLFTEVNGTWTQYQDISFGT